MSIFDISPEQQELIQKEVERRKKEAEQQSQSGGIQNSTTTTEVKTPSGAVDETSESKTPDKFQANFEGVDYGEAERLANETLLAKIMYGRPQERMRMTDETVEGMNKSRGLYEQSQNMDLLGSKLNQMQYAKDAARYAAQSGATAAAGASASGGDYNTSKMTGEKVANASGGVYGQMAGQLGAIEQNYNQQQMARNQLSGQNNTDMVSHSNTREYISEDHPLKPLIDKLAMQQGAANYLANKNILKSGNYSATVNGRE